MHCPTANEPRISAIGTELTHEKTAPEKGDELMLELRKSILLLATLVATVTYAAGFNPPGGVWQKTVNGHLAGDPIIQGNHKLRYLVFFYCNATAFASSLLVIVLVLLIALLHEKWRLQETKKDWTSSVMPLRVVMVLDLLSVMGAYAAGTCRDTVTTVYSSVLVSGAFVYLAVQMARASWPHCLCYHGKDAPVEKRLRKVLMLLATFAVSVTYIAGMSTPGGFWDDDGEGEGHSPGDAILKDRHGARLTAFLCFNTTAFVASLLIIVVLLDRKHRVRDAYKWITVAMVSLVGAYTAGSCRETDTTVYVASMVVAVLIFITLLQTVVFPKEKDAAKRNPAQRWLQGPLTADDRKSADKARSLVLLLATLAATITYQAGLDPPGGVWPENQDGHQAGDPILLTTNATRYKAFYYCNSTAFVASLVAIILVQNELLLKTHVLEAAMILNLFGLIGAYAAGSCRDVNTSIYTMGLAGVVLVYVVIHVVFFTLDHSGTPNAKEEELEEELVEKRRKRLLLFAVLAATITYQAGLTPPGGFLLQDDAGSSGHHAGDPVLLSNSPHRYTAFFYCNAVSFMLSIALIILLVNPHLYRPAIRSYALSVCTVAGLLGLMGAYAAGSTQNLKTSIYIFVLVAVVLFIIVVLLLVFLQKERSEKNKRSEKSKRSKRRSDTTGESPSDSSETEPTGTTSDEEGKKKKEDEIHAKRKYLMLLGILVASVTYQTGLDPPGGAWQRSGDGYDAGNSVMHYNRRPRYLIFFYSNSASLVASIVVVVLLLLQWQKDKVKWSLRVMNTAIFLDLLALLGAYAAGSSREWKTSLYVVALVIAVLAYVAIHAVLSFLCSPPDKEQVAPSPLPSLSV